MTTYECQHPAKGQAPRNKRAGALTPKAKPAAAWFKSLTGDWQLITIVDAKEHPTWMDYAYTLTEAKVIS